MISIVDRTSKLKLTPPDDLAAKGAKVKEGLIAISNQRSKIREMRRSQQMIISRDAFAALPAGVKVGSATDAEIAAEEATLQEMILASNPLENQYQRELAARAEHDERDTLVAMIECQIEEQAQLQRKVRAKLAHPDILVSAQAQVDGLKAKLAELDAKRDKEAARAATQAAKLPADVAAYKAAVADVIQAALVLREKHNVLAAKARAITRHEAPTGGFGIHIPGFNTSILALSAVRSRCSFEDAVGDRPNSVLNRMLFLCKQFGISVAKAS
jgi:hypothetical protein